MTMDRVYNPHRAQHGFQQQAVGHGTATTHTTNRNQPHHVQARHLQSSPPPPPPPPTMMHQYRHPNNNNLAHPMQESQQLQSNLYHPHHPTNHHNHLHQYSHDDDRHAISQNPHLHRPVHPPPPPPSSQESQSVLACQQSQSHSVQNYPIVPSMINQTQTNQESSSVSAASVVMRNSLPAAPRQTEELTSEKVNRSSLQNNYYSNNHYQYYQPSNLRRHPTHHNKYIPGQQQLLQPNDIDDHHASNCMVNPKNESKHCDNAVFDSVDQASQDSYTEKVIQAILAAKDALEKPIEERDERDILLIDNLCSLVHGFDAFPKNVRRALAAQTVLIVIDEKGKELIVHNEELDSFCVLIFGECEQLNESKTKPLRYFSVGDAFGVCEPTTETIRFVGHMVTKCENCAFLCVKRDDFYTILTDSANYPSKLRHRDRNRSIVCVSQFNIDKRSSGPLWSYYMQSEPFKIFLPNGYTIVKATESCLLASLVDGYERLDQEYVDDFLLLFRVFMSWDIKDKEKQLPPGMIKLCMTLAKWLDSVDYRDRVVKIVLTWLSSYYHDFELNTEFSYLFFRLLESRLLNLSMNNQLHLLHVTLTTKSKIRHVTISRSSREQPLAFAIAGGYEKNCGIFVTQVHGSYSEDSPFECLVNYLNYTPQDRVNTGPTIPPRSKSLNQNQMLNHIDTTTTKISTQLKPGDQILEVNGTNFSAIKLAEAQKRLDMSTHLSLTVKYNPSAFHEMRALPEGRRKSSMSSLSSVSPFPQPSQRFTFNLHDQHVNKNGGELYPPASPLFSPNANFGLKSIMKSAPKNDRSRLSNLINSSRQLVKQIRESTAQSNNAETASKASDNVSDDHQNIDSESSKFKSNPDLPSLKGKGKQIDYGLANVVRSDELGTAAIVENATNGSTSQNLVNVLRVFNAANNDSRYLLIHEETTAREAVMVAVKEFNLTGGNNAQNVSPGEKNVSSLNWHLYEVSVVPESRTIKQKCLSEQTSRLAERASLCSRFYIKNNSQSSGGPTKLDMSDDALVNEILKESPPNVSLTSLNATLLAVELTLADFDKFRSIEPQQFVYDTFFDCCDKQKQKQNINTNGSISSHDSASLKSSSSESQDSSDLLHMMNKTRSIPTSWMHEYRQFADISNREMFWVICEILNERNIGRRVKIIKQFVHVADVCSRLRNYNSMFAIISGLGHSCVARLRRTFDKLKPKYKNHLDEMRKLFDPSKNMSNYRTRLSDARPPSIPLFPQIKKDLTFTKEGRSIFVREPNDLSDDDDETNFSQDTIRRKTRGDLLGVESATMHSVDGTDKIHHLPIAQTRTISFNNFTNSQRGPSTDVDSVLVNFADIRQFTDRVRNVIYFSSVPYSNDLLTDTKESQRNLAQIKKMHEEWQMRKRIRHYLSQTLANSNIESPQLRSSDHASNTVSSGLKLDQIDGPSSNKSSGKLVISYDERTLYLKSLEVEPELNSRPQMASEPRQTATTAAPALTVIQATQSIQLHPPMAQVAPILNITPLHPIASHSSPTLSKSSSLSSCSSFSHHLPNYHAVRASSNLSSGVGKFGTESTESLRKLKALSENVDDWRSSSCNTNNNNHLMSGNIPNNGLSRVANDGRGGLARNLVPSRIFPPKNGK